MAGEPEMRPAFPCLPTGIDRAADSDYERAMIWTRRSFIERAAACATALAAARTWPAAAAEPVPFPRSKLTIDSARGRFVFDVEVANTWVQRRQGLQGRRALPRDAGMLFDFREPQMVSMWMKDTFLSLDMMFIDADGVIFSIAENTVPLSLEAIGSGAPVLAVLEVNGGTVARLGIRPGDRVHHPIFDVGK